MGIRNLTAMIKTLFTLVIVAFCALLLIPGACVSGPPHPAADANVLTTDKFYGLLTWDNKALFNNCWGTVYIQQQELAASSVSYDPATAVSSWRWSWPEEAVSELKGYPSLIVGDKAHLPAGFDASTDPRFPLPLAKMRSLWAAGEVRASGNGAFDFAFDLLFLAGPLSRPEEVRSEIMVWLASSIPCAARREGEYTVDGRAYDFFVNTEWHPDVPYLAFVLQGGEIPSRVPLHEFIRIGIKLGYVRPDSYLAAVELGPEIWWGDGSASVRGYRVTINGE